MQAPPLHLLEMVPLIVVTKDNSVLTSLRSIMGHSGDSREWSRSALEVSWAVSVTLDGMKQPPRLHAGIDLVPTMVRYCNKFDHGDYSIVSDKYNVNDSMQVR
jgi:hypothetical protein